MCVLQPIIISAVISLSKSHALFTHSTSILRVLSKFSYIERMEEDKEILKKELNASKQQVDKLKQTSEPHTLLICC